MGRSTSVYFFCLAKDPIFVVLHQIPRVLVAAGYVDDTTIVGLQNDSQWIAEIFSYVNAWKTARVVMDIHNCWQVGFSENALPEGCLLKAADVWEHVTPFIQKGKLRAVRLCDMCLVMHSTSF